MTPFLSSPCRRALLTFVDMAPKTSDRPERDRAWDARAGREGVVMAEPGVYSSRYWLRPVDGGTEWEAEPEDVQLLGTRT